MDLGKVNLRLSEQQVEQMLNTLSFKLPTKRAPFDAFLYGDMVQKGFTRLYGDTKLSDVVLVLGEGDQLPVHRIVLSVWSEPLRALLQETPNNAQVTIPLDKEDHDHFKLMVRHMYTGETDFINRENVLSLLSLSDYFGIHSLKETCGELLGELVTSENLFFFLEMAEKYQVKSLEAACGVHLAHHFQELAKSGQLEHLEPTAWAEMAKNDSIRIESEEMLFDAALSYVSNKFKGDKAAMDDALNTILPAIRFPHISADFLATKVEENKLLQGLPLVQDLLYEAYRFQVHPSSVDSPRTELRKSQQFDAECCNPMIHLSSTRLKATGLCISTFVSVRCSKELTPDNPYVEFYLERGLESQVMIGLVVDSSVSEGYAGQLQNGCSYAGSGVIYKGGSIIASSLPTFKAGDKMGVLVGYEEKEIFFYTNGVRATRTRIPILDATSFYPSVSMSADCCVHVMPFAPLPNDARPLDPSSAKGRARLTTSTLERTYGDNYHQPLVEVQDEDAAIDGTVFIKRFLRFKF